MAQTMAATAALDKLAEELILKGVLFLGAGLGLCIALRVIEGLTPSNPECYIRNTSL
jgi:hypothetical protein